MQIRPMGEDKPTKVEKLFWIDLEMTGLDINKEVIIECAALITDLNWKVLEEYEAVVKQPQHYLDQMDAWNRKHHRESGLLQKIPGGVAIEDVESQLFSMVKRHFPKPEERPILAGNSVNHDRSFIDKYMPGFGSILHYRMLDVSSWKIIFAEKFGVRYEKKNAHRALDDIKESLEEIKFYTNHLKF